MPAPAKVVVPFRAGTEGRVDDSIAYPLIEPGEYAAVCHRWSLVKFRQFGGAEKLVAWFTFLDAGECFGVELPRFWRVEICGTGKRRRFKAGTRSTFARDFCRIFPDHRPHQGAPWPMDRVVGQQFLVRVETVTRDAKGKTIPEQIRYSRIAEILRRY